MGNVLHFQTLGLDVEVREDIHMHDDGIVDDLASHLRKLGKAYGCDISADITDNPIWQGHCQYFRYPSGETHFHIFYIQNGNQTTFVRGHEEATVLWHLKKADSIGAEFLQRYGFSIPLPDSEEGFADVGGMLALLKAGINPSNIKEANLDGRMLDTFKIYEKYLNQIRPG